MIESALRRSLAGVSLIIVLVMGISAQTSATPKKEGTRGFSNSPLKEAPLQGFSSSPTQESPKQSVNNSPKRKALLDKLNQLGEVERRLMLIGASELGYSPLIDLAIQEGLLSPDEKSDYTLLTAAATHGHLETVKTLLRHGADIKLKDSSQDTPIKAAARAGRLGVVLSLIHI